MNVVKCNQQ